ncbi:MAG: hypothetical protein ACJ77Z_06595 [Thermoleophilaceae bacterium]
MASAGSSFEVSFRAPEDESGPDCCLEYSYELMVSGPRAGCLPPEAESGERSTSEYLDNYAGVSANGKPLSFDDNPIGRGDVVVMRFRPPCAGAYRGSVEYLEQHEDGTERRTYIGDFAFRATGHDALASTGADPRLIAAAGATLLLGGVGLRRVATSRSPRVH